MGNSNGLQVLLAVAAGIGANFVAAAYFPFPVRQPIVRCNHYDQYSRRLHFGTLLHSQRQVIRESDTSSDYKSRYEQRVAVLLPSLFEADNYGDSKSQNDAIQHLRQLATKLKLSVVSLDDQSRDVSSYTHLLTAVQCPSTNTYAIAIHANPPSSKKKSRDKKQMKLKLDPIFVDLCPSSDTRLGYRMNLVTSNKNELLLKALGKVISSDKQKQLVIYDLTAGLARDSMIMLSSLTSGIDFEASTIPPLRLHMVERDPLVASLLADAMRRLDILANNFSLPNSNEVNTATILAKCLSMEENDALSVLERLAGKTSTESVPYPPDIVYLDPMFPPRKKKASSVKKDMAMLHSLLGTVTTIIEDKERNFEVERIRLETEQKLLEAACQAALKRVVVKRPVNSLPLGFSGDHDSDNTFRTPSFDIRGNINRWDVYYSAASRPRENK